MILPQRTIKLFPSSPRYTTPFEAQYLPNGIVKNLDSLFSASQSSKITYLCTMKFQTTAYRGEKTRALDPLPVMEQFYTLQGEGAWTGEPTYFVRLAGCDVGCHWCDVKESWGIDQNQYLSCDEIVAKAVESGTRRVVITGGEPTMHDLTLFTEKLRLAGLKIHKFVFAKNIMLCSSCSLLAS